MLETADKGVAGRGPDPAEFEPELTIDDEDGSSRAGTPGLEKEKTGDVSNDLKEGQGAPGEGDGAPEQSTDSVAAKTSLPTDVRVKLRKLDKLEGRYQGRSSSSNLHSPCTRC